MVPNFNSMRLGLTLSCVKSVFFLFFSRPDRGLNEVRIFAKEYFIEPKDTLVFNKTHFS